MLLRLNDQGLPESGRKLDAWIAQNVMRLNVVALDWPCGYTHECCIYQAAQFIPAISDWQDRGPVYVPDYGVWPPEPYTGTDEGLDHCVVEPVPFYSTTHAYHQVMETRKEWHIHLLGWDSGLDAILRIAPDIVLAVVRLEWADYPNREAAYAHAVCAVVWKAKGSDDE